MKFQSTQQALLHFAEMQLQIVNMENSLKALMDKYKADTKEYFGVEDGKPINLVQLANVILKLNREPEFSAELDIEDITGAPV